MQVAIKHDRGDDRSECRRRIQVVKEGKKRRLVINGVKLENAGKITCKTNADEATADLGVKRECRMFLTIPFT